MSRFPSRIVCLTEDTLEVLYRIGAGDRGVGVSGHAVRTPEGKKNAGSPGFGGPMVTAGGLVFIGATRDRRFRAFDSKTGKELWSVRLDYNVTAIPMTYQGKDGKQYLAVVAATGGQGNNESLLVWALP